MHINQFTINNNSWNLMHNNSRNNFISRCKVYETSASARSFCTRTRTVMSNSQCIEISYGRDVLRASYNYFSTTSWGLRPRNAIRHTRDTIWCALNNKTRLSNTEHGKHKMYYTIKQNLTCEKSLAWKSVNTFTRWFSVVILPMFRSVIFWAVIQSEINENSSSTLVPWRLLIKCLRYAH